MSEAEMSTFSLSMWEEELLSYLRSHVQTESAMLSRYVDVAEETESKAFRYLVELLIEDERRHHRMFSDLADALEASAVMKGDTSAVPSMDFHRANRASVLEGAAELLRNEEQDLEELKELQHKLRAVRNTTLWSLLVDLMQRDTEKHIAILKFVCSHA